MTQQDRIAVGPVVQRYARALFGLAARRGELEAVSKDVERLSAEVTRPKVRAFLLNPRIGAKERLSRLEPLLQGCRPIVRNLVHMLFERGREGVLVGLGLAFHDLELDHRGAAEGVAESARPLAPELLSALEASFGQKLGKRVHLVNEVRPELMGGVRVRVGSQMLDATVVGRLDDLRRRMLASPMTPAAG